MGITAYTGPVVSFGQAQISTATGTPPAEYNSQAGPSMFFQGQGIMDPRPAYNYKPGADVTRDVTGWWGTDRILVLDGEFSAAAENTIAQTQSSTTATSRTLTLTASNTANATVGVSITRADTGATVTGLVAIEGAASTVTFGSDATINFWNPSTMLARRLRFEGSSDDSAGAYTITGYDVYGYPMTETVTGSISTTAGSTFVTTLKAWKYISTIVASGTHNSTGVTIGVTDGIGLPLYISSPLQVTAGFSSATTSWALVMTSTSAVTPGSTVATQTSTTPDVRGIYLSTTALSSQGHRAQFWITPNVASLGSTGLFGGQQA